MGSAASPSGTPKAATTPNTYSHVWSTAEDRTRKAASELYGAATPDSVTA